MKTSSAIRVNVILQAAAGVPDGGIVYDALAKVFGFNSALAPKATGRSAVALALTELQSEIDSVESELKGRGATEDLSDLPIRQATDFGSMLALNNPWQQHKQNHLRQEVLVAWRWAAFLLPSQEDDVTPEVLEELVHAVQDLENVAKQDGVAPTLRAFIMRQAQVIRMALRSYQITGVEPLKTALSTVIGNAYTGTLQLHEDDVQKPENKSAFKKFMEVCTYVAVVTKAMDSVRRLAVTVKTTWPALEHTVSEAIKFSGGGPGPS